MTAPRGTVFPRVLTPCTGGPSSGEKSLQGKEKKRGEKFLDGRTEFWWCVFFFCFFCRARYGDLTAVWAGGAGGAVEGAEWMMLILWGGLDRVIGLLGWSWCRCCCLGRTARWGPRMLMPGIC